MSPYVFGIVVAIAGGLALWRVFSLRQRLTLARSWPRARGRVTRSNVEAPSTFSPGFRPHITYEYEVAGVRRTAEDIAIGGPLTGSLERALDWQARHPVGAEVEVTYNPRQPNEAFLLARITDVGLVAALGAACMVCGAALAAAALGAS